jgi:hypothetical protein
MAPAIARPRAADFPAASKATVLLRDLSKIESRKLMTALPCEYFSFSVYGRDQQFFLMPKEKCKQCKR